MQPLHLTGNPVVKVTGENAADFTVTLQPAPTVERGTSVEFEVAFTPGGPGMRRAVLSIANDDSDEPDYEFAVQARRWSAVEVAWRNENFGDDILNTGLADDYDKDGVSNLLEFAFNTWVSSELRGPDELQYNGTFAGGGSIITAGQPVTRWETTPDGQEFRALFSRRRDYEAAGLIYTPQFSNDLVSWEDSVAAPELLAQTSTTEIVSVPYPSMANGTKARFFRLIVRVAP